LQEILKDCKRGGAIQILDAVEAYTDQQRRWWKGVLLRELAKDSGDSIEYWETKLKLAVLPDEFTPFYLTLEEKLYPVVPSITKLSSKKMNLLIEGSVAKLHEWGFMWVTLPEKELKKT
jgi:hypothetical protein